MKVKTADLIGPALDWAVATIEGYGRLRRNPHAFNQALIMNRVDGQCVFFSELNYSEDWSQGGPIIEREWIELGAYHDQWRAVFHGEDGSIYQDGPTPLVAALRCFISSRLGDEIEIPEELLK